MPKGPNGEKRPADVIGAAVLVGKIATGEVEDRGALASPKKDGGRKGGPARAKSLTPAQRSEIASMAASARWKKSD